VEGARHTLGIAGRDPAFIGHSDLDTNMGHRRTAGHPELQAAALRREEAIRLNPVALGEVAPTPEQANTIVAWGYGALIVGIDRSLFQTDCATAIEGNPRQQAALLSRSPPPSHHR
jgi:4-hydroxy-2-oxoheptanedioate aldolase